VRPLLLAALGGAAALSPLLGMAQSLPDTFAVKLSPQGVARVEKGLMELPYKDVAGLLSEITQQVRMQNDEWQKAHAPPALPPPAEQK
jgi:hypothetical protein